MYLPRKWVIQITINDALLFVVYIPRKAMQNVCVAQQGERLPMAEGVGSRPTADFNYLMNDS